MNRAKIYLYHKVPSAQIYMTYIHGDQKWFSHSRYEAI